MKKGRKKSLIGYGNKYAIKGFIYSPHPYWGDLLYTPLIIGKPLASCNKKLCITIEEIDNG